ncbi:hypothetical protein [Nocardioides sp. Arc9.136]|uniref:hypothetical protein n=1 Tax=Nocardioides sp. Arc9.136 TaxID=2996826 RepID=UPI002665C428|nr:hypothetical protein [Nocardioides sp. Arc9.136]WKN46637.1 hypothetical protein OSR43_11305 [Nocardioides sp. Arc9.136]
MRVVAIPLTRPLGLLRLTVRGLGIARLAWSVARLSLVVGRDRRHQRENPALVARPSGAMPGVLVIDHTEPLAFCLPHAWRGHIFVTTAALAVLPHEELTAVLAHGRARLRGNTPRRSSSPDFSAKPSRLCRCSGPEPTPYRALVATAADDVAVRRTDRRTVASALLRLAEGSAPATALRAARESATGFVGC